jgi:hypothetical protein
MPRRVLAIALFVAVSAGACRTVSSSSETLRIVSSHYRSMSGVSVPSGLGPMTCSRDMITGSHILHWYCRFEADPTQYQLSTAITFVVR